MPEDRPFHLGIACPLPPTPTGPATYVARMLPALAQHAEVTCFVADPGEVDGPLRDRWAVRHLDERHVAHCDLFVYHLANNPMHREILAAALDGPPGLVVLHDASLHHLLTDELVAPGRLDDYTAWLREAHGDRGEALGQLRLYGGTDIEQFVFEALGPVLDRHLGVLTHSRYAASIVEHRCPGVPVFVVPHFAPAPAPRIAAPAPRRTSGEILVGHFGYVTSPKRYDVICRAMREVMAVEPDVRLVFVGEDHTRGDLERTIRDGGLEDVVTVTGWLDDAEFEAMIARVDVAVSLRWPQVGESSGTLASLLGAGKPTITEAVGSWSELPDGVVVRINGEADELAAAVIELARSERRRDAVGASARAYASSFLGLDRCAASVVDAARRLADGDAGTAATLTGSRQRAVDAFLSGGEERLAAALGGWGAIGGLLVDNHLERYLHALSTLPPARPGAVLVDLGCLPPLLRIFAEVWGYDVVGVSRADPLRRGRRSVSLGPAGGLPAMDVEIEACDLECDRLPFATGSVDVVVCWEVLEHLGLDPMHLLTEINRVLTPTGMLHLTTPNSASAGSVAKVLDGETASIWPAFLSTGGRDRHNREYTPAELRRMLAWAGLSPDDVWTIRTWADAAIYQLDVERLREVGADVGDRGDNIVVRSRKTGLPLERYPAEFYA